MKNLIVYATTHGCTEKCAVQLKNGLTGDVTLVNIKNNESTDLRSFDTVIIGGSIHAGMIQGSVKKFCSKNMDILLTKRIGLFLCCSYEGDQAREQFEKAFPEKLKKHASVRGLFGGAFDFDRMNFIQKAIIKKVSGVDRSVNNVDENAISTFVKNISEK